MTPTNLQSPPMVTCSFCGKRRDEVEDMVGGPRWDIKICNECVKLCAEIMEEARQQRAGQGSTKPK